MVDDDDVRCVLDPELDFYSASLLKQQSAGRYVASLGHNILIMSQPVFALKMCAQWKNSKYVFHGHHHHHFIEYSFYSP
jgi:hypothetical protein